MKKEERGKNERNEKRKKKTHSARVYVRDSYAYRSFFDRWMREWTCPPEGLLLRCRTTPTPRSLSLLFHFLSRSLSPGPSDPEGQPFFFCFFLFSLFSPDAAWGKRWGSSYYNLSLSFSSSTFVYLHIPKKISFTRESEAQSLSQPVGSICRFVSIGCAYFIGTLYRLPVVCRIQTQPPPPFYTFYVYKYIHNAMSFVIRTLRINDVTLIHFRT